MIRQANVSSESSVAEAMESFLRLYHEWLETKDRGRCHIAIGPIVYANIVACEPSVCDDDLQDILETDAIELGGMDKDDERLAAARRIHANSKPIPPQVRLASTSVAIRSQMITVEANR